MAIFRSLLKAEMGSLKNKDILGNAIFLFERLSEEFPSYPSHIIT